jgi:hypothetical protein
MPTTISRALISAFTPKINPKPDGTIAAPIESTATPLSESKLTAAIADLHIPPLTESAAPSSITPPSESELIDAITDLPIPPIESAATPETLTIPTPNRQQQDEEDLAKIRQQIAAITNAATPANSP